MKVLQFVTRLDLGGAQEICLDLSRELLREGHEVHLLTGAGGELLEDARRTPGLVLHAWPDWVHPIRPLADLRCAWRLLRLLRHERYDVLHTHSSKAGLVGRLVAAVVRTPRRVIHHVHGWSFNALQPALVRYACVALERLAARPGFLLLACGEDVAEAGRRAGVGRELDRRVVVNGIDRRPHLRRHDRRSVRRRLGLARGDLLFLQLGNLKPQKDPLNFARAAVEAGRRTRRARFWICGDGPLTPEAERIAAAGGLATRFRVLGWRRDVDQLLAGADVLVLTSRFEGLPIALVRGMTAGLPVVATAIDGTREVVQQGRSGLLVPPQDFAATAQAMVALARQAGRRRRMGRLGRRLSGRFRSQRATRQTLDLYHEAQPRSERQGVRWSRTSKVAATTWPSGSRA